MINHVRTLLLNRSNHEAGLDSGAKAAEFIPMEFRPITLPRAQAAFRRILLPDGAPLYQENYILANVMKLLHHPELLDYTLTLDPRFTYSFTTDYAIQLRDSAVVVNRWSQGSCDVNLIHDYTMTPSRTQNGVVLHWELTHAASDGNVVTVRLNGAKETRLPVTFTGTKSNRIVLVANELSVFLTSDSGSLNGDFKFDLDFTPIPYVNVATMLEQATRHAAVYGDKGGIFSSWEPYATEIAELYDLWRFGDESTIKLGALILGHAFICEQLRLGVPVRRAH